jgi:hypothetical protein
VPVLEGFQSVQVRSFNVVFVGGINVA